MTQSDTMSHLIFKCPATGAVCLFLNYALRIPPTPHATIAM